MQPNQTETLDQEEALPKEKILRIVKDGMTALVFLKHLELHLQYQKIPSFLFFPDAWLTECPEKIPANAAGTLTAMHLLTAFYDVSDLKNHAEQDEAIRLDELFSQSIWREWNPYRNDQYPCFAAVSKNHLPDIAETFSPEAVCLLFPRGLPKELKKHLKAA